MAVLPAHKTDEYERYEPFIYLPSSPLTYWHHIAVRVASNSIPGFTEHLCRICKGNYLSALITYTI